MLILISFLQVELAMTYGCDLSQEQMVQYVHFNRLHNTMLIEHNDVDQTNKIDKLKTRMDIRVFQKNTFSRKSKVQPTTH